MRELRRGAVPSSQFSHCVQSLSTTCALLSLAPLTSLVTLSRGHPGQAQPFQDAFVSYPDAPTANTWPTTMDTPWRHSLDFSACDPVSEISVLASRPRLHIGLFRGDSVQLSPRNLNVLGTGLFSVLQARGWLWWRCSHQWFGLYWCMPSLGSQQH